MHPKLIGIVQVRNEADIIEPFVRHHASMLDEIVILEDGSSDATDTILSALQQEGLPLVVLRRAEIGYDQSRRMSGLMRHAFDTLAADWVIPLDADEFLEMPPGQSLRERLTVEDELLSVPWSNFVWSPADDANPEPNPVLRLKSRTPPRSDQHKVLVPARLGLTDEARLWAGNHGFSAAGLVCQAKLLSDVVLCHFPVRSFEQFASKVAIKYLQYRSFADREPGHGLHYDEPFEALKSGRDRFVAVMEAQSRRYSAASDTVVDEHTRLEPLRYAGDNVRFTHGHPNHLGNLLSYSEKMADRLVEEVLIGRTAELKIISQQQRDHQLAEGHDVYLLADGVVLGPSWIDEHELRFLIPSNANKVLLKSISFAAPGADKRRLGVIIHSLAVSDGAGWREIALDDSGLQSGFHEIESQEGRHWRWTDGQAHLSPALWAGMCGPVLLRLAGVFTGLAPQGPHLDTSTLRMAAERDGEARAFPTSPAAEEDADPFARALKVAAEQGGRPIVVRWPIDLPVAHNWGDKLNAPLVTMLAERPVINSLHPDAAGLTPVHYVVGSGIRTATAEAVIWGSGFIGGNDALHVPVERILAVRGPLTARRVVEAGGARGLPMGDPALLLPLFYDPDVKPHYDIGLIQHFREIGTEPLPRLPSGLSVRVIDITGGVKAVIDAVVSCRRILSSSLHGLIVAHAYGIPATWLKISDRPLGDDFKFRDYWASIGRDDASPVEARGGALIDPEAGVSTPDEAKVDLFALLAACPFLDEPRRQDLIAMAKAGAGGRTVLSWHAGLRSARPGAPPQTRFDD